jgi:hypothetical protein
VPREETVFVEIVFDPPVPIPLSRRAAAKVAAAERRAARAANPPSVKEAPAQRPRWSYLCPNCGDRFMSTHHAATFCGLLCRSEAEAVRYVRRKVAEYPDRSWPDDIAYAVKMKIAHTLGGGYDKDAHKLPPDVRRQVIERDLGACQLCGAPGNEIDHIRGPSADLGNLRLLCKPCHHEVTDTHLQPIDDEATAARSKEMIARMYAREPLLPSDADDWATGWRIWTLANREPAEEPASG